jgi:hypothetical protein
VLLLWRERFCLHRSIALFDQHLNFTLGGFEFLFAEGREADAFFEELDRIFEREITIFELAYDFIQLLQ